MQCAPKNRYPDRRSARFVATALSRRLHRRPHRRAAQKPVTSPLRQLQLEPAIAAKCLFSPIGIERLKFAKSGGDKTLRRYALGNEILYDRDRARRRQRPVGGVLRGDDRPYVGVSVHAQHPGDFWRNLLFEIKERDRELVELIAALLVQNRRSGVEEQLGLENEPIAYHPYVRPRSKNLPQLAEISDASLGLLISLFRGVERLLECRQLAAERRNLLIEDFNLSKCPRTDAFFCVELAGERVDAVSRLRDDALYRVRVGAGALDRRFESVAFALCAGEARA